MIRSVTSVSPWSVITSMFFVIVFSGSSDKLLTFCPENTAVESEPNPELT